ncbi:TPA: hypothetical protein DD449_01825 [Candidatus Berkelbacteria bacterium]|uniref:Uncharacterized protein n=1 Tax=Berkelbacteria bacterium GW2011_GWE1_39_12 TaxID=1618337 RepID=A0A0G4B4G7_9BACT|nr:MAG: hypothetical protein UT28_C0001G0721 [Berkelbacteria bacterium GW2011_GWE1_39_12]HBO60400.1 hypothetical protein [Candidatus Berkelbacteria bacterium]
MKILNYFLRQIKYFFFNPFWLNWFVLLEFVLILLLNFIIWYLYLDKYKDFLNLTPIVFSSAVAIINLFMAVIIYPKEKNISIILLTIGLMVQFLILFFIKMTVISGSF